MAVAALVSVAEYLGQTYHPDVDYLEGTLLERNVGEIGHSDLQTALAAFVRFRCPGYWAGVELRMQVKSERFRVPDVVILRGGRPEGSILTSPPLVAVEVLSPSDRMHEMQSRIDDYLAFGATAVWVLDPISHRAFINTHGAALEVLDGYLTTPADVDLKVPLNALFPEVV